MVGSALPFPVEDPRPPREQRARYVRVTDERLPQREYHYALTIPRAWSPSTVPPFAPVNGLPLGLLGQYRPAPGELPTVEVSAHALVRDIAPAEWLIGHLARHEQTLLHERRVPTKAGDVMDALTEGPAPGVTNGTAISRWRAIKDGLDNGTGRIVLTEARIPRGQYSANALDMLWASNSLELLHPSGWPYAEKLRTYCAGRPGDFLIYYPYSWQIREERADETLDGILITELENMVGKRAAGKITVICSGAATQPRDLIDGFLKSLAANGLVPWMDAPVEIPPFGGLERAWAVFGKLHARIDAGGQPLPPQTWPFDPRNDVYTRAEPSYDLHLRVGHRERSWYLFALTGWPRLKKQELAAINERAFAIVVDNLRTERAR